MINKKKTEPDLCCFIYIPTALKKSIYLELQMFVLFLLLILFFICERALLPKSYQILQRKNRMH